VTIPPPSYIDIAHHHGVKILGTLIFEWDAGAQEARLMLDGKIPMHPDIKIVRDAPDGNRFYARKLAEIAKHYGFDGYLMNFECEIDDTKVLIDWLKVLREELHKTIPGSLVIWYDSVLHDGSLKW
jgi:mannosyl-glycoprotein endo-beta-N-acetylglucosaminidase